MKVSRIACVCVIGRKGCDGDRRKIMNVKFVDKWISLLEKEKEWILDRKRERESESDEA